MTRQQKIPVADFASKLSWCFENLVPRRVYPAGTGEHRSASGRWKEISNLSNLYDRLKHDLWHELVPTRERWLQDVREDRCNPTLLKQILAIYPEIDAEPMIENNFHEFRRCAEPLVAIRDKYVHLGRHFLQERHVLAQFSKQFYRTVDETPDWPLVARDGWRLERPLEISENTVVDQFLPWVTYPAPTPLPGLNARYSQIRRLLSPSSILPFNGDCYRLSQVDMNDEGRACFSYGPCSYFDYYDTCEIHALKMSALQLGEPGPPCADILDLESKASVPGINTLTIFKNYHPHGQEPRGYFLLHRRSSKTVQAGGTLHVVPSGQHQPSQAHYGRDEDVSIWRTMVREFCEEIYGVPEAHSLRISPGDQLVSQPFRKIVDPIFRSGAARSFLLGVGLDPVTAKAEILVVTVVDFYKVDRLGADHLRKLNPNWEGNVRPFALTKAQVRTQLNLDRSFDLKWLPAGKACLSQFLEHFDLIMAA